MSSVKLRTRILKDGRQKLYLDIYYQKKNIHKTLEYCLEKSNSKEAKILNEEILLKAEKIRLKVQEQLFKGTFGRSQMNRDILFVEWFTQLTEKRKKTGKNYHAWKGALKHLKAFFSQNEPVLVKNITKNLLEEVKEYLLSKLKNNSVSSYFDVIKASVHEAHRQKMIEDDPAFEVKSVKYEDPEREFLTIEEVKKLIRTECYYPMLKKAFLFSVFTGMRYSDVKTLKWSDIEYSEGMGHYIRIKQQKTKKALTVHLTENAVQITGKNISGNFDDLIFPGIKIGVWQNVKIKEWALKAGIAKNITFHIARHTFACISILRGIEFYTLSKLLGHKDLKTTQIYAKIVDPTKIEAINKLPVLDVSF